MVENVHALTARSGTWQETPELVKKFEPHAAWIGELLRSRHRHQGVTVLGEQITAWLPLLDRRGAQRGRSAVELCLGSHHCRDRRQADPVSLRSTGAHSDRSAPGGGKFPNTAGDAREFESKPHPALQRERR